MSTHKKIDIICVVVMICAIVIAVLFMNGSALGLKTMVDKDSENYTGSDYFTDNDLRGDWDMSSFSTKITLKQDSAKISGNGAYSYDGNVYITKSGYYEIAGELTDGSIIVDAKSNAKVWLKLCGADISCSDDAALIVDQADKVFLTLAEGSENYISSGEEYSEDALEDNTSGAIFAHDDLTINGSGALYVTAEYKHGIVAKDDLVITGGSICVTAPGDGIRANDSLRITSADITVNAGDDGIVTNHEDSYLYIESGTIDITSADDGIHANASVTIDGGDITVAAGDDGIHADSDIVINDGTILISESYEGIEGITIDIRGGDITVYCSDDGLNANGDSGSGFGMGAAASSDTAETWISISGGSVLIINETGRDADGLDSNGDIYISGGDIRISLINSGSNSAIDYASENNCECVITGGTVIAAGSYSMAEHFDSASSQASILYTYSTGAEAGTTVSVTDEDGETLLAWDVPCSFSSINLSCPEMTVGGTYTVQIGDNTADITIEEVSASYGDAQSSGFGGTMNFGGMNPRENGMGGGGKADMPGGTPSTGGNHGMNGGGGMNGGPGGASGSEMPSFGEGEMPEMAGGEMPSFGEGEMPEMAGGEMPSFGEGEMPEMAGGEMPSFGEGEMPEMPDGEMPSFGDDEMPDHQMEQAAAEDDNYETDDTAAASDRVSITELGRDVWLWLGISAAVLAAGLVFAFLYRKGKI